MNWLSISDKIEEIGIELDALIVRRVDAHLNRTALPCLKGSYYPLEIALDLKF